MFQCGSAMADICTHVSSNSTALMIDNLPLLCLIIRFHVKSSGGAIPPLFPSSNITDNSYQNSWWDLVVMLFLLFQLTWSHLPWLIDVRTYISIASQQAPDSCCSYQEKINLPHTFHMLNLYQMPLSIGYAPNVWHPYIHAYTILHSSSFWHEKSWCALVVQI